MPIGRQFEAIGYPFLIPAELESEQSSVIPNGVGALVAFPFLGARDAVRVTLCSLR
jgi:hypothetical protein